MNWGTWLAALAPTLARRVLSGLGFGFITFTGVQAALELALAQSANAIAGLGPQVKAIVAMGGWLQALGIVAGAFSAAIVMVQLKRLVPR